MNSHDAISRAVEAIAEAQPEILATMPKDELRWHVEQFVAGLVNVALQRKAEVV